MAEHVIPELATEKEDIQAFITSGFGHLDNATYLFLNISNKKKARSWLKKIVSELATAAPWEKDAEGKKIKPAWRMNIAFSYSGFEKLGLSEDVLSSFSREFREGITHGHRPEILGDVGESAPENWDIGGPKNDEVHIFLSIYWESEAVFNDAVKSHIEQIEASGGLSIIATEEARRLSQHREHFGFQDGIGQPKIRGVVNPKKFGKSETVPTGEFVLGYQDAYDFFASTPVVPNDQDKKDILPDDPNPVHLGAYKDFGRNGTYVVYRKLEQDVAAFWKFMLDNAETLPSNSKSQAWNAMWLASKSVGRWPSGISLVAEPDDDKPSTEYSDAKKDHFLYLGKDENGLRCPFGSHIRRNNPRDSIMPKNKENSLLTSAKHRILRRGMTYGELLFDPDILLKENRERLDELLEVGKKADKNPKRGFQFIPVMANIQRQFELLQQSWANNPAFNGVSANKDPIIGNNPDDIASAKDDEQSYMFIPNKPNMIRTSPLPRFVTVKGGAYLFMPSIRALRYLAETNL